MPTSRQLTGIRKNLPSRKSRDPPQILHFEGMGLEEVEVKCYSSRTYAERPQSFFWKDKELKITSIENEWLEPGKKFFRVVTEDEKVFQLCYNEPQDKWWLTCQE